MAVAYYNEHDPFAAAWLRNLISAGHIAPGDVDERDIRDVVPTELVRYTQCHFFAGIWVWSLALRLAGWPDDRPVWTGSCPCQPFSAAGKREGLDDERHLWPAWHHLIRFNRPDTILGEQVASPDGLGWLDLVYSDLEGEGYTCGSVDLCAAGVGAPHIRQRLWFVGMADSARSGSGAGLCHREPGEQRRDQLADGERVVGLAHSSSEGSLPGALAGAYRQDEGPGTRDAEFERSRSTVGLVDGLSAGLEGHGRGLASSSGRIGEVRSAPEAGEPSGLADDTLGGWREERSDSGGGAVGDRAEGLSPGSRAGGGDSRPGPVNGFWRDVDWLFCRDGRWRPARSGSFPLVNGASARVGRLRAYGNAISPWPAKEFIEAVMKEMP